MIKLKMYNGKNPPINGFNYAPFVFPESWVGYHIKDLFKVRGGRPISRNNMSNTGVACLHYGDIHTTTDLSLNVIKQYDSLPKVKDNQYKNSDLLQHGDVIFADASEDYAGVAKSLVIENKENRKMIAGLHTVVASIKNNEVNGLYRRYMFSNWLVRKQLMFFAQGISVYGISKTNIENTVLVLPPFLEQKKIAEILSTWDEAIDLQTKLINEKKVFLSNLALSLVKNHKSLVNFESSWGRVSLFDVYAERKEYGYQDENFELYSLTIEDGVTAKTNRYNREFLVKGDKKKYKITKYHDLVFNPQNLRYGAIALNYNQCPILLSPIYATLYIKDQNKYDVEYFNFLLTSQEMINYYDSIAEGTLIERMTVKPKIFLKQEFNIPPIEEQRKISMMLIEMRNEISILEKELELKKLQKQGLMQQLLTGKIRVNIK